MLSIARPLQKIFGGPGIDHPIRFDTALFGPVTAVALPGQLTGGMGVGIDGEETIEIAGQLDQTRRRVTTLRSGIDLNGCA